MTERRSRQLAIAAALALTVVVLLAGATLASSQVVQRQKTYDGRFMFARISYETAPGGYWYRGEPAWSHGYPRSEQNLMRSMNEVSHLSAHDEDFMALPFDDPDLFKYPIVYIAEVSWWTMTDREGVALRDYLKKGGFVIVDDFKATGDHDSPGWDAFESNILRAIPDARFIDLDGSEPIFHCFFEIESLQSFPQAYNAGQPVFRGLYEDNDPTKRLQMIVNYNSDISQYWSWSNYGPREPSETSEGYKLGVNYIIYGLTH